MKAESIRSLAAAGLVALLLTAPGAARAADPCAGGGSLVPAGDGIGGTGRAPVESESEGLGGTGIDTASDRLAEGIVGKGLRGDSDGIGGTGLRASADGIGGTGRHPDPDGDPDEGGIGGTGLDAEADSGVIGVVTGFASICVGGREIHYGSDTPVTIDDEPGHVEVLAVGQVVEVAAAGDRAVSIQVVHEVEGEVTEIDTAASRLVVLGQSVALTDTTWTDIESGPALAEASMFEIGDQVRVGGYRDDGNAIVASRVERLERAQPSLRGSVDSVGEDFLVVSGVRVSAADSIDPEVGETVRVAGTWDGSAMQARVAQLHPRVPFDGRVERVRVEGIVRSSPVAGQVRVGRFGIDAARSAQPLTIGQRVRVDARVRAGVVVPQRIAPLQSRVPPRRIKPAPQSGGASSLDAPAPRTAPGSLRPKQRPRTGQVDRPRPAARIQRPERPRRVERPRRPQRPIRPERPPRPERPLRPVRPERPQR